MEDLNNTTPNETAPTEEELTELRNLAFQAMQNWIVAMGQAGKTQVDVMRSVSEMMQGSE